jgi:hypothetical protein
MLRCIFVLVGIFGLTSTLQAADKRCELKQLASLDVDVDQNGTVLIPATIEGHDVWMILSLDQGLPMLFQSAVRDLQLTTSKSNVGAASAGQPITRMSKIKQLNVGRASYKGWEALVLPVDPSPPTNRGKLVAGMLTSRLIQVVDMELNLAENKVNLFSQTRCSGEAVYWGGEYTAVRLFTDPTGLLVFPMEIDGHTVETSFNTASRYSNINTSVTRQFFGFDKNSKDILKETSSGREVSSYRAMTLSAKGLQVRNSKIRLQDSASCLPTSSGRDSGAIGCQSLFNFAPFSIGTDLLKSLRVYIASKEQRVYFTRVEAGHPALGGALMPAPAPAPDAQAQ